ncbi:gamma-butyrobetaine hydroxylase-like domain-containing protein [Congregibacter sp.]|uniref:gamma-butyrobetaine hydroxylase-like domain-containing protein n=1 Tax=Congregibacter sp. TaxID=2744308 RepID=UPI003F6D8887
MTDAPRPIHIRLRKQSRVLELEYANEQVYSLSWEYLRVYSPSAEVRGHHESQAVLQAGKQQVGVSELKPVGHYALQIVFDDGHDSGLYAWDYLYRLCTQKAELWQAYLDDLAEAGASREPDTQVLHFQP